MKRSKRCVDDVPKLSFATLELSVRDDFEQVELLWSNLGETSIVRLMRRATALPSTKGKLVVIKSVKKNKRPSAQEHLIGEVDVLRKLASHPNILELQGCFTDSAEPDFTHLILNYEERGDLFNELSLKGPLEFSMAQDFFRGICKGLAHMHSHNIVHQDLSLENVLIGAGGHVVLADFGLAAFQGSKRPECKGCGKAFYMSPEMVQQNYPVAAFSTDVWSAGICLFSMIAGTVPFSQADPGDAAFSLIASGKLRSLLVQYQALQRFPESAQDLVQRMLCVRVGDRIKLPQIMDHAFLQRD
jgi:serine/threonine protein kinase